MAQSEEEAAAAGPTTFEFGYARVVGSEPGDGPVLRSALHPQALITSPPLATGPAAPKNIYDCFAKGGLAMRPTAPCLGSRHGADGKVGNFNWQSYEQVSSRIDAVAAALWAGGLVPKAEEGHRFLGMYCKNSRDWMVVAEACYKTGVVVVPMYDTLGPETVGYIQKQTGCATVLCTAAEVPNLLPSNPFAHVIVAGPLPPPLRAKAAAAGVNIHTLDQLERAGAADRQALRGVPAPGLDDLALLCYTSGTTGDPKGAMLTHRNIIAAIGGQLLPGASPLARPDLAAQPQEGDTLKIIDDLCALRPTIFVSVPRLYNRIYDKILAGAESKGGLARALFRRALDAKLRQLHATGHVAHGLWDRLVFAKVRASVGLDRCTYMITGSAPISPPVKDFMRVAFGCLMIEGYGMTESATAGAICHPDDVTNGHVGMPSPSIEIKLRDVTEMGYLSNASPPRGEVCMRGPPIFLGYFKMPDKTEEARSADGWLFTGDIGEWTPQGQLRIIDRKKNIFKLAQGEYVAAEKIENVITRCPLVAQAFVYGDGLQSWLVAIIVPDAEEVLKWAAAAGVAGANTGGGGGAVVAAVLAAHGEVLTEAVQAQVHAACSASRLAGFEVPRRIRLEAEPWTPDNGLLTPTFKLKRNEAKKKYADVIDAMYKAGPAPTKAKL